jgi:hypothetical protein
MISVEADFEGSPMEVISPSSTCTEASMISSIKTTLALIKSVADVI